MTPPDFEAPEGATPLDPDLRTHLIPHGLSSQAELNEFEARNIADALR